MVDQQEFHHALLRLVRHLGGLLGSHHHAVGHRNRARRLGFRHGTSVLLDLDKTLPTCTRGFEQRVVAEPWYHRADPFRRANDQLPFGDDHLRTVDRELHVPLRYRSFVSLHVLRLDSHDSTPPDPASAGSCRFAWFSSHNARNSSRKYLIPLVIGLTAPSPNAQNERPNTSTQTSNNTSMSSLVPLPHPMRSSTRDNQNVPSRHGVHLPQDSCS